MKLKLPETISSPQDLKATILEVRQYARWFSHASVKKQVAGGRSAEPPAISGAASSAIKEWAGDKPLTLDMLEDLLAALEDFEKSAPQLTITLAAAPGGGLKKTLVAWCRTHVEPNVLVNFDFNSTLLGGMVVRYRSHVFDWSFRRQILAARGRFPEVLRRV